LPISECRLPIWFLAYGLANKIVRITEAAKIEV
jgi:hypothetical protein